MKERNIQTVEVPLNVLINFFEGYEDLLSLASVVTCHCDDQPNAEYEDAHRGDTKGAYAIINRLITASPKESEAFAKAAKEAAKARKGLAKFEVSLDLGIGATVYAEDDDEAVEVAEAAANAELNGAPLPQLAESVELGEYHAHDPVKVKAAKKAKKGA